MEIEQQSPNKPNFGLVVGLFAVTILVVVLLAIMFIHWDGKHLSFGRTVHAAPALILLPELYTQL